MFFPMACGREKHFVQSKRRIARQRRAAQAQSEALSEKMRTIFPDTLKRPALGAGRFCCAEGDEPLKYQGGGGIGPGGQFAVEHVEALGVGAEEFHLGDEVSGVGLLLLGQCSAHHQN